MTLEDLELLPASGSPPFQTNDRLSVGVLQPVREVAIIGDFVDGQFVRMIEEAEG